MRIILFGVLMVAIAGKIAYAQQSYPDISIGARNASLANANISESADISAMYENPAAIAFVENGSLFLNHSQTDGSLGMQENLAIPLVLRGPISIGLGLDAYHYGLLRTSVPSNQRVMEYGYDMAVATPVTPTLSIGGSAALRYGLTGNGSQAWGSYFSAGADYAPSPDVSYSMVWTNMGRNISYLPSDSGMTAATSPTSTIIEVGATMTYPSSASLRPPLFILSLASEKIMGITGLYYKGGIEVRPIQRVQLRFGYMAGPGVVSSRYGVGVLLAGFDLQYALEPVNGTKSLFQQFSFALEF